MGCSIYRLPEKAYQQKRLLWCLKGCDNLSFLNERRQKKDRLSDVLQWHHLLTSNIILLKDGSLMSVIQYRGPDLDSSTDIELMNVMGRINNVLRHFSGEWVVNFESQRNKTVTCPKRHFPDPVCQMIDLKTTKNILPISKTSSLSQSKFCTQLLPVSNCCKTANYLPTYTAASACTLI